MSAEIPVFPELVGLELAHRPALEPLLRDLQPQVSELTFTNLYIWRHAYGLRLTRLGQVVLLFSWRPNPEDSFLLPPLGPQAGPEHVRAGLDRLAGEGHDPKLARVDREQDVGEPGLRRAKESYHPVAMVEKFVVRRRS